MSRAGAGKPEVLYIEVKRMMGTPKRFKTFRNCSGKPKVVQVAAQTAGGDAKVTSLVSRMVLRISKCCES